MKLEQPKLDGSFKLFPSGNKHKFYWGQNYDFYFKTNPPTGIIRTFSGKFIVSIKTYTL